MARSVRAAPPSFGGDDFRAALAMFATGVTIVTARTADGAPVGLTANSFNSVSIEPPLVLWSLSRQAGSMPAFARGSHYAINILAADQHALAVRFASKDVDRFERRRLPRRRERRAAARRRGGGVRVLQPQPLRGRRPRDLRRRGRVRVRAAPPLIFHGGCYFPTARCITRGRYFTELPFERSRHRARTAT